MNSVPKKKPKILDGTFYEILAENEDGGIKAKCTECDEVKKGRCTSTGNFKSHYKLKHEARVKDLEKYLRESDASKPTLRQKDIPESISITSPKVVRRYHLLFSSA